MRAVDLIRIKRDGGTLDRDALHAFVSGVTDGSWPDYQAAALLMAIFLRGMTAEETAGLTDAMVRSGVQVDYPDLEGVPVDKHSTGGVGDKTSIVLAPLAAACGAAVPMMSGRGLGHTGGTLDKLESIPGFRTALSLDELRRAVQTIGCALIGQTSDIAPADRRLYALRDVTSTVESIPLISASIMSKKIAEGIGGLVLDVKAGDGAFMKTLDDARRLAESLVSIGEAAGVRTEALLTSMDAPLGRAVGNAVEIIECVETLKGNGPGDVEALSVDLATRMLIVSGVEPDPPRAEGRIRTALADGSGLEKLKRIVENQGGDPRVIDEPARMPSDARSRTHLCGARRLRRVAEGGARGPRGRRARCRPRPPRRCDRSGGGLDGARPAGNGGARGRSDRGDPASRRPRTRRRASPRARVHPDRRCGARSGASGARPDSRKDVSTMTDVAVGEHPVAAPPPRAPYDSRDATIIGGAVVAAAILAVLAHVAGIPRLQPFVGLIVIMTIAYALSTNRRAIDRRTVAWGLSLQVIFALIVLKTSVGRQIFQTLGGVINRILDFAFVGSSFVFGPLGDKVVWPRIMTTVLGPEGAQYGVIFAFQVLPDDHLHRGALRHPLLLRRHAARCPGVRRDDAAGDARERRGVR